MTVYLLLTIKRDGKRRTCQAIMHALRVISETEKTIVLLIDESGRRETIRKADILTIENDEKRRRASAVAIIAASAVAASAGGSRAAGSKTEKKRREQTQ